MAVTEYFPASNGAATVAASVTNAVGTTAKIEVKGLTKGCMEIPSGATINTVTWYGTTNAATAATAVPLTDNGNTAVTQVVAANNIYELDSAVFSLPFAVPVATNDAALTITFYFERE